MTIITKEMAERVKSFIDKLAGGTSPRMTVVVNFDPKETADILEKRMAERIKRAL